MSISTALEARITKLMARAERAEAALAAANAKRDVDVSRAYETGKRDGEAAANARIAELEAECRLQVILTERNNRARAECAEAELAEAKAALNASEEARNDAEMRLLAAIARAERAEAEFERHRWHMP